jgi:NADPH:quinone reductase
MLQLRSLIDSDGTLHLSLAEMEIPTPAAHEVVIRIEASPINPSDLGLLLATVDPETLEALVVDGQPHTTGSCPPATLRGLAARVGESMPVGNEGAGEVVAAGEHPDAQALLGKLVGVAGGAMYGQYRAVPAASCMVMPDGVTAAQAASPFVNPLTALGMVETMRLEGHTALVHTAAASNLGQMLNRVCLQDGVELVNIVRKEDQAALLRSQGAKHVVNSSDPDFMKQLVAALTETKATLAFDATGGGTLAGQILQAMERAVSAGEAYSRYGSSVHKQVYLYGGLDLRPLELNRGALGMAWGLGGWLLTPFIGRIGMPRFGELRARVAAEITTTFASTYTAEISLTEALDPETIRAYQAKATGEKFLICPQR